MTCLWHITGCWRFANVDHCLTFVISLSDHSPSSIPCCNLHKTKWLKDAKRQHNKQVVEV
jgi:hypothetical protein